MQPEDVHYHRRTIQGAYEFTVMVNGHCRTTYVFPDEDSDDDILQSALAEFEQMESEPSGG